jgi:chaperonin GroES
MQPNRQYFIVSIDKEQQAIKREKIVLGGSGYLGCRYADGQDYKGPGVILSGVEPGSPAQAAGFKAKDIILGVEKVDVNSFEELADQISKYAPGETITLKMLNSIMVNPEPMVKKVKLGQKKIDLENPAHLRDMRHNLQFGEVVDFGPEAIRNFPHAKIGDTLIFHHSVEYKGRMEGDSTYNDVHLIGHDEAGNELRLVNHDFEILGVLKYKKGKPNIIPHPKFVFCHMQIKKAAIQHDAKTGLYLPESWEKTMQDYNEKLEELAVQVEQINSSSVVKERTSEHNYRKKEEIKSMVEMLMKQKKEITRKMHQKKLVEVTVLYFNEASKDALGYSLSAGDKVLVDYFTLYPLDIQGVCFSLARVSVIEAAIFKKPLPFKKIKSKKNVMSPTNFFSPLHDRVILKMHEAEVITESGLIIPDVAQQVPGRAVVVACGPGTKEYPMQAKAGDVVLLSKFSGTDVEYGGEKFRFIHEAEILTTLTEDEAKKANAENERVILRKAELQKERDENAKKQLGSAPPSNLNMSPVAREIMAP